MKTKTKPRPKAKAANVIAGVDVKKVAKAPIDDQLNLIEALQHQLPDDAWNGIPTVTPELAAFLDKRLADAKAHPDDACIWDGIVAACHRARPLPHLSASGSIRRHRSLR